MQPAEEILNIDFHVSRMVLSALNRCLNDKKKAASLLGVTEQTLYRYIKDYGIKRHSKRSGHYYFDQQQSKPITT